MKKVFLHEPDADIFEIMTFALDQYGYIVKQLPNPDNRDFREHLISSSPDLVIVDCFLDKIKPAQWCNTIKSIVSEIKIIATSCDNDIHETYRQMGFDAYLSKPFDFDDLIAIVKQHTRQLANQ